MQRTALTESQITIYEDIEMKNLTKLTLLSASLFAAGIAQASDTQLIGTVEAVCEAEVNGTLLMDFGIDPQAGDSESQGVEVRCNDGDGATVELRSAEGGLESDDNEDFSVEYTATLVEAATGINLSLTTSPGVGLNDEFVDQNIGGSAALAGGVVAALEVTLNDTPVWSGGYSDTLSVEITAN